MNNSVSRRFGRSPRKAAGFSMLEVLITIVVASIGLLGIAGMQVAGLRFQQSGAQRSQATLVINDLIDRMRANPTAVAAGAYDAIGVTAAAPPALPGCIDSGCDPDDLASHDIAEWTRVSLINLPGGTAETKLEAAGTPRHLRIILKWTTRQSDGQDLPDTMETEVFL